jgi:Flp pilus assembly protein TadG
VAGSGGKSWNDEKLRKSWLILRIQKDGIMRKNILKNVDANIAVTFAIALLPMITFVGIAIDYSRASATRTAMQSALDSTTLMVARDAAGLTASEISSKAQAYFTALVNRPELKGITITAKYTQSRSTGTMVETTANGNINAEFSKIIGAPTMDLGVKSTVTWGNTRNRVALALDATGSMKDDNKMAAMQTAAKQLIDKLSANSKAEGDLYISLIPFSTHINFGSSNFTKPWLDWTDWEEVNGDCSNNGGDKSRTRCAQKGGVWKPDNHSTWNGCITDRDESYDVKSTPPSMTIASSMFDPEQIDCPVPLVPLTTDWISLKTRIDQMSPVGSTNQPVGMAWAWLSLLPTEPLKAPAEDPSFEYKRIMIVLSDGMNTKNKKAGNGATHSTYVDDRQKLLCDNIKADGVTIYTIQVNTDRDPTSSVLQYCASGADNFVMLTSASQIMSAFDDIGAKMSKLRVSK